MKLAIIGATGTVGSRVVPEALRRGHAVTAISRNPEVKLSPSPGLTLCAADVMDFSKLTQAIDGHDAVISTYNVGHASAAHRNPYKAIVEATRVMIAAVKRLGIKRFLYVGGCGSLYIAPGVQLADDPPAFARLLETASPEWKVWLASLTNTSISVDYERLLEAHDVPLAARLALLLFEHDNSFDWSFVSPPLFMGPGERTGRYQLCGEELPMRGNVPAGISIEDLAVAILDEIEKPKRTRQHWTVAEAIS